MRIPADRDATITIGEQWRYGLGVSVAVAVLATVAILASDVRFRAKIRETVNPPTPRDSQSVAAIIAEAEAAGARHPRASLDSTDRERRCVEAGKEHAASSGELAMWGFSAFGGRWRRGNPWLEWSGKHEDADAQPSQLTVDATRLDRESPVQRFALRGHPHHRLSLSAPGRWMLVATNGVNWGCFIFEF